jgi:hypothetical protein
MHRRLERRRVLLRSTSAQQRGAGVAPGAWLSAWLAAAVTWAGEDRAAGELYAHERKKQQKIGTGGG